MDLEEAKITGNRTGKVPESELEVRLGLTPWKLPLSLKIYSAAIVEILDLFFYIAIESLTMTVEVNIKKTLWPFDPNRDS